jgi:hypothetical protein
MAVKSQVELTARDSPTQIHVTPVASEQTLSCLSDAFTPTANRYPIAEKWVPGASPQDTSGP